MKKTSLFLIVLLIYGFSFGQNLITGNGDIGSPTLIQSITGLRDIEQSGNYLFLAVDGNTKIQTWDISDPSSPTLAGSVELGSTVSAIYDLHIVGNVLYICSRYDLRLWWADITDPSNMSVAGSIVLPDFPTGFVIDGNYAYVESDNAKSLQVIELSPTPTIVATRSLSNYGTAVIKVNNNIYVGVADGHLVPFDVTTPSNPVQGTILTTTAGVYKIMHIGGYLYIAEESGVLQTVSFSTPQTPTIVNSTTISTGKRITNLDYDGTYLFAGTSAAGQVGAVTVFDLTTPAAPSVIAQSVAQNINAIVAVDAGYAYTISKTNNLGLYSYTLTSPQELGTLDFDGSNDYVNIGSWNAPTNLTVEAWVYPTDLTGFRTIASQFDGWATTTSYILRINDGTPTFYISEGDDFTAVALSANQNINTNEWCHISATYDGSTAKIYINGILANQVATSISLYQSATVSHRIGSSEYHGEYFAGKIDEVKIWNTVKTECDIYTYMNTELNGDEEGLIAYFDFNSGIAEANNSTVTTLEDKSINAFDGTLMNFALNGTTSNWIASTVDLSGENADITLPTISCIEDQAINLNEGETFYTVVGDEFSPTAYDDNCGVMFVINDYNSTETLTGEEIPVGTREITWVVSDNAGNLAECTFNLTVNTFGGIQNLLENGISIYPNPTANFFYIDSKNVNIENIILTDITGKIIIQTKPVSTIQEINLSNFVAGFYLIHITTEKATYSVKIIKK